jgi:hypothetical protein
MPHYVIIEEAGPQWDTNLPMRDQDGWDEHAKFMNTLTDERLVVLGGPLGNYPRHRALLVLKAANEQVLRARLAEDPWMISGVLQIIELYSWEILLGELPP